MRTTLGLAISAAVLAALWIPGCASGESDDSNTPASPGADAGRDVSASDSQDAPSDSPADLGIDDLGQDAVDGSSEDVADALVQQDVVDATPGDTGSDGAADVLADTTPDVVEDTATDAHDATIDSNFCALPAVACTGASSAGTDCSNAVTIARSSTPTQINGELTDADGDDYTPPESCALSEADRFYRVFLYNGETLDVTLRHLVNGFNGILAVMDAMMFCTGETCDITRACQNAYNEAGMHEHVAVTATHDGWYTIVVDSRITPLYSYRFFELVVSIDCTGTCGC